MWYAVAYHQNAEGIIEKFFACVNTAYLERVPL
jgi:hypothetical protein